MKNEKKQISTRKCLNIVYKTNHLHAKFNINRKIAAKPKMGSHQLNSLMKIRSKSNY